jgi:ACS family glucarate transporter-like MFS transporter
LPPSQRPTHVRFIVMAFLGSLAFLTYFDRVCITRAQTQITSSLQISDGQMGLIMGAFWLAYALFELPAGTMGDRYGARITLSRIVLAWSLFTALSGSASGFASLFIYRFVFGAGEAGAFPNMARIQSRWLPLETRSMASGMLWMLARWGGAFSYPLFGMMMRGFDSPGFRDFAARTPLLNRVAETEAWRISFWAAGIVGAVWVGLFFWWFRDHPSEKKSVNQAELDLITRNAPPEVRGHSMPSSMWKQLLTNRSLLALGILYLCSSFGWSFFVSWMPKYFAEVQEMPYKESEWMTAAPLFCGGITCFIGGILCNMFVRRTGWRRFGRAIFPICGYVTSAMAMFFIPYVKTPQQAMLLLCLAEAAHDFGQAANWASIVDIGGMYAGAAAGLINTIGNMGNAFQPYIGNAIREHYGWNTLFNVYGGAFLIAASMWLLIDPRRKFYENNESEHKSSS